MKNILASLAARFRRLTTASSADKNSEPQFSSGLSAIPEPKNGFNVTTKLSPALTTANSPTLPQRQSTARLALSGLKPNGTRDISALNPDFITRDELKRELDIIRRLIENHK